MELKIKNVGIIAKAEIKLNGLTVVTGANSSGKTTLGRVLYSLVSAVEFLQKNAFLDKLAYTQATLDDLFSWFPFHDWAAYFSAEDLVLDTKTTPSIDHIVTFIDQTLDHLKNVNAVSFKKRSKSADLPPPFLKDMFEEFESKRSGIIEKVSALRNALLKDPELIEYANKRIEKKINTEFFGQIASLSAQTSGSPECILLEGKKLFFNVLLDNSTNKKRYYSSISPFGAAFFVDDVSIVDELTDKRSSLSRTGNSTKGKFRRFHPAANNKAFLEAFSVGSHKDDLMRNLLSTQETITGEIVVEEQTAIVMDKLSEAVSFGIEWKDGRFVSSDLKIDLRNLAQGSKAFLIIKMLLENGVLRKDSLLVLDEPEARLHPKWQVLFAEATVLLVKHLGCTVLLTTHSPDFVIALDVASRKHEIWEGTKFYISKELKTGLVTFDEVNDDAGSTTMNDVYFHLSKNFMELESQRLELIHSKLEGEEVGE